VNKTDPKQPLSPTFYLIVALVGFSFAVGFTFFYIYQVPKLVESGVQDRIFYLLLMPWGLSCAAFLFGAMRSYARYTYKDLGNVLEIGGPIVLFCLVMVGGFKLVSPPPETFDLAVQAHSSESSLITSGQITLDLPGHPHASIGPDGEANFKGLSAKLRGRPIRVLPKVDGYEEKWLTPSVNGDVLTAELQAARPTFTQNASLVPPPPKGRIVQIRVDGQEVNAALNDLGEFKFTANGSAGDRVLVEVLMNQQLVSSEYEQLSSLTIQIPWNLPSGK
jgi:hypothetical protein